MGGRPLGRGAFFGLLVTTAGCSALLGIEDRHADQAGVSDLDSGPDPAHPIKEAGTDAAPPVIDGGDGASRYRAAVLADNPALYFRFGEKAGTTSLRNEVTGLSATYPASGVELGVAGPLQGDSDTAISFHGGVISVTEGLDFSGGAPCAIELWMRRDTTQATTGFILDHEAWSSPGRRGWDIHTDNLDFDYDRFMAPGQGSGITLGTVTLEQWHHWVVTYESGKIYLYFDGVLQGQQDGLMIPAVAGGWTIGGCNNCGSAAFYEGSLDELAIYTHVLTTARVTAHYAAAH